MPIYSYICQCSFCFEVLKSRDKAGEPEVCPQCSSIADRDWQRDNVYMKEPPKTLGSLADKNADKLSQDKKDEIISRNKRKPSKHAFPKTE